MNILYNKIEVPVADLNLLLPSSEFKKIDSVIFYLKPREYQLFKNVDKDSINQNKSTMIQFAYFVIGFKPISHYIKTHYPYIFDHFQYNNGIVDDIYCWVMKNKMNIKQQQIIQYKNKPGLGYDNYIIRFANEEDYIACKLRWG